MQLRELAFAGTLRQAAYSFDAAARVAKILAFVCFTAVAAQVELKLPFTPVPVTMQTLFVVLAGSVLGARDGFYALLAYVGIGFAGAPVFAGFGFGPAALFGPTGGYLLCFPAAALVSGFVAAKLGGSRIAVFAASLSGMALILASGASYLALLAGLSLPRAAALGVLPFVAGELVKALVAAFLSPEKAQAGGLGR